MNLSLARIIPSLFITIIILFGAEIFSSAFLPVMGIQQYHFAFYILIILFIGFKVETSYLPFIVLIVMYCHSFFSIEGWGMGTIAGITVCLVISSLRGVIHLSSKFSIILLTQLFQLLWFVVLAIIVYLKMNQFSLVVSKFWRFIPESIVISLLAPFFFMVFDRIWNIEEQTAFGEGH